MKTKYVSPALVFLMCAVPTYAASLSTAHAEVLLTSSVNTQRANPGAANDGGQSIESRAPSGISETFFACVKKADSDTIEVAACISDERAYQDARLNKTYKALLSALDTKSRDALVTAEKEWLSLVKKDTDLESHLYSDDQVDNLQQGENEIFRLCERANLLDRYLDVAKNK